MEDFFAPLEGRCKKASPHGAEKVYLCLCFDLCVNVFAAIFLFTFGKIFSSFLTLSNFSNIVCWGAIEIHFMEDFFAPLEGRCKKGIAPRS